MPIELTCPGCGKQLRLADEHAGKAGRCPACQATFQIPTPGQEQSPSSPFGGTAPTQPLASAPNPFAQGPPPAAGGNLFGEQNTSQSSPFGAPASPPNPFASTSNTPSPYGGVNPYSSPTTPNMYAGSPPGEGQAIASMILGIVSIVFSVFGICCCGGLFFSVPCGVIGLILAYQVPPERRMVGLILNIIGLALSGLYVLFLGGSFLLQIMAK